MYNHNSQEYSQGLQSEKSGYDNASFTVSSPDISPIKRHSAYLGNNNFEVLNGSAKSFGNVLKDVFPSTKEKIKKACTKKMLYRRVPILDWLPRYDGACAVGDFVAGITVGLTLIPQALAYYSIVGLPPQYGLYSSFVGCFVYIIFGSCKDVPFGPSAINALLTAQAVKGRGPEHAILLCFLIGLVQILMGLLGLGFIVDFVSGPVSSGFTSAVALIIVTSQVKDILGIHVTGDTFVTTWESIISEIHNTQLWDTVIGVSCIVLLMIMRIIGSQKLTPEEKEEAPKFYQIVFNKLTWMIGTGRNIILVLICGLIGFVYCSQGAPPFRVIGNVPKGLPEFKLPPFGYKEIINGTEVYHSFSEMVSNLGSGIIIVPLIGLMENIAICKAFANGKTVDATQELLALGLCNIGNSFVQGYPGTGALARSAVNNSSGVRTPLGGFYTGVLVIAALLIFTPYFYYIPNAVLGAVIIAAVVFMVEIKVIKPMWRSKKSCFIVFCATFIACLVLHLEVGILVGIGINLLSILYHAARPKLSVEKLNTADGVEYLMLTPDRCLIFPSVAYIRNLVTKYSFRQSIPVVMDCSHIYGADYTAATVIEMLTQDFLSRNQPLLFYNLKPSVCAVFEGLSPKGFTVFYAWSDLDDLLKKHSYVTKEVV
ncbi:sodium-independent sulfate anion transporter isoform X2 [Leptinotarsa decemlineata]|uniref:sodium-independent sulfate anion transporter isoform X2 n=1 Tax=Leptinotarsa decemlineata TaxID=7539 RepID=UPI000C253B21|nr:sodium-independent sulfate anion transporter-like [Leptinotarsa decemlineata]